MTEREFNEVLGRRVGHRVAGCNVAVKKSITYHLAFDERGRIDLGQNADREPTRGGGTGFQCDLLAFEESRDGDTSIIPRVIVELKVRGISTHGCIVYSEKAHLIRSVYPYVRYGLLIGECATIPSLAKILRFGQEFDFITVMTSPTEPAEVSAFKRLLGQEVRASRAMGDAIAERTSLTSLRRLLKVVPA